MERRKSRYRHMIGQFLLAAFLAGVFALLIHHSAYASGWIDGTDSSIYDGGEIADKENTVLEVLYFVWDSIKNAASDLLSAMFSDMLRSMGDRLYYMLSMAGIDINSIIYGRVGGASFMNEGVALFTYELVPGNPYGIISMYMYGALRMVFVLIIICIIAARLAAFLYSSGGSRQREKLKDTLSYAVIVLLTVMLMPYILGVVLFLRDVVLYIVMTRGGELVSTVSESIYPDFMDRFTALNINRIGADIMYSFYGSAGDYNIISMFRETAGGNLFNSLMYIGAVVLTAYFAFAYGSAAMSQLVLVVTFPFACVVSLFDRSVMKAWAKQVCGTLMIPIIDSFLLLVPIFFGLLGKSDTVSGYTLIQFILCCCIIPARGVVRMWLGFGGSNAMELAGIGALMGALQLGKAIAGTAIGLGLGHMAAGKTAAMDTSMADMLTERQGVKDMEEAGTMGQLNQDIGELFGIHQESDGSVEEAAEEGTGFDSGMAGQRRMPGGSQADLKEAVNGLEKRKAVLTDEMKQNDVRTADINRKSSALDEDIALLKADKVAAQSMGAKGEGRAEECDRLIAENELEKKKLAREASDIRKDNSIKAGKIARIDSVSRRAREAMISMRAAGGGGAISEGEQAVLDKYANIDNFETPDFKQISMERRAELHRERAAVTRQRARLQLALGATGAVAGATVAAGATMFGSPAVKMYGSAMGIQAGSGLAAFVEESSYNRSIQMKYQNGPISAPSGSYTEQVVHQPAASVTDRRGSQARITQKETVHRQVLVDHQMDVETSYTDSGMSRMQDFGDQNHQWTYGGESQNDAVWNQLVSTPEGMKRISTEVRRALARTSSEVRLIRHEMDGDFERSSEDKNREILENAMNTFSSELSFNFMNNGLISDGMSYNPDSMLLYLETKVRNKAPEILKEKLQSMGLLY